jgi:hypothetical protein
VTIKIGAIIGKMIDSYTFGRIVVEGKSYTSDVVIFPTRVKDSWRRREGHQLCPEDIEDVLEERPETLVVGTGYHGSMRVLPETLDALKERGIEVVIKKTREACEIYNGISRSKKVIAALHLTC